MSTAINKPDWFDLDNYQPFKELSINEWEAQLYARSRLNLHLDMLCDENPESESYRRALEITPLELSIDDIQKCPIVPQEKCQSGWAYVGYQRPASIDLVSGYEQSWPIFFGNDESLADIKKAVMDSQFNERKGERDSGLYKLFINLNASDASILKDFSRLLKGMRQMEAEDENNMKKQIKSPSKLIKSFVTNQVIPYIDLKLWARYNKEEIVDHVIADWLYPNEIEIGVVERIRKTTRPLANKAISNRSAIALRFAPEQD